MELQYCPHAFNNDNTILDTLKILIDTFEINYIIETGTYQGNTTQNLAINFPNIPIVTIEIDNKFYIKSKDKLLKYNNISCINSSSDNLLNVLLKTLKCNTILFYLDAHGEEYWPLLDELDYIGENCKDNCCIVIDDFKVPNRNFNYDVYKNIPLDINYIDNHIKQIFTNPFYFFNNKTTRKDTETNELMNAVGKIYIYPAEWNNKFNILPFKEENRIYYAT